MAAIINASTSSGLIQTADTSGVLRLQSNGTTQFTVDSTGAYGTVESGTAVASTSGTSIDFTGLPSWVKRITVMFNDVSTNGSSIVQVQLGAGSVTSSGYIAYSAFTGPSSGATSYTTGMGMFLGVADARRMGHMILTNVSGNIWLSSHVLGTFGSAANYSVIGGGNVTLGGTLDRVRITTVNGTDTFDAGSINILYEG
jgi:hypothetical protein